MASGRSLKGFTLIEMLVSMVVLILVIGLATYGYSLFIRHWDGRLAGFERAQAEYQRLEWLAAALEDTLPYIVRDGDGVPGFYFLGRPEGLTLVTMSPVFGVGEPALIRVFREPDPIGGWQLIYEEAPFAGEVLARADQYLAFQHRLVIARGLPQLEFRYFGWEDYRTRSLVGEVPGIEPEWFDEYDGLVRNQHPQRIALEAGAVRTIFEVPARADLVMALYAEAE
jgi:prepilin-type N-terminal cleavage/methylation domain-containing protein